MVAGAPSQPLMPASLEATRRITALAYHAHSRPCRDYRPNNGGGTGSYEDGSADPLAAPVYEALHSGCPVVEGEKWVATRWIRGNRFY